MKSSTSRTAAAPARCSPIMMFNMLLGPPHQDVGADHLCVGVEVDVALLLDPRQGLTGRPLEENILLVLVQPLLLGGPVLQDSVLLSQQLLQDN